MKTSGMETSGLVYLEIGSTSLARQPLPVPGGTTMEDMDSATLISATLTHHLTREPTFHVEITKSNVVFVLWKVRGLQRDGV